LHPLIQADNPSSYGAAKPRAGGLRPRDANMPVVSQQAAAPAAENKPAAAGRSMSQLLAARSEAAMNGGDAAAVRRPAVSSGLPDIDSADAADPLNACDFVADIFSYYRRMEPQMRIAPDYMSRQVGRCLLGPECMLRGLTARGLPCAAACRLFPDELPCQSHPLYCALSQVVACLFNPAEPAV
jgi:hypothetical protein